MLTCVPRLEDSGEGEFVELSHYSSVIARVRHDLFLACFGKSTRIGILRLQTNILGTEPVATVVPVTIYHGDFDASAKHVLEITNTPGKRVASSTASESQSESF